MNFSLLQRLITLRVLIVLAVTSLAIISCRDGGETQPATQTQQRTTVNGSSSPAGQANQNPNPIVQNAGSEFHYVCANNCEGSGANAAGTCAVCGEELIHNTAFHAGEQGNSNSGPQILGADDNSFSSKITPLGDPGTSAPATVVPAPSGGTGFHYICSAGCGGGGNAQGSCPSCGAALVHNAAFHTGGGATAAPGALPQPTTANKYPSVFNTPGAVPPAANLNTASGFHYICSAGCGGGGSAQGSCPSCGAALVHNDAFH